MGDPYNPGKIGVTIKVPESKRYAGDNPWFVFEGNDPEEIKGKIGATFGVAIEGLTLGDVVINAQRHVSGLGAVAHGLGGQVLATGQQAGSAPAETAGNSGGGDVWDQAAAARTATAPPEENKAEEDPILAALAAATTVTEVQQVWAENQSAFNTNPAYMDAYRARGKALSS